MLPLDISILAMPISLPMPILPGPSAIVCIIVALFATMVAHLLFVQGPFVQDNNLPWLIHWSVIVTAFILLILSIFINYSLVKKELYKMV